MPRRLHTLRLASLASLAFLAAACSKAPEEKLPVFSSSAPVAQATAPPGVASSVAISGDAGDARLNRLKSARANLLKFYFRTFDPLIKSDFFIKELPLVKMDHMAHRLLVAERDPTLEVAIKAIAAQVKTVDAEVKSPKGDLTVITSAYFLDADQLHRDQYVAYASEMGFQKIGNIPLTDFLLASEGDYGVGMLSQRKDLPWTATFLAGRLRPGASWINGKGERTNVAAVVRDLIASNFRPDEKNQFACYDIHGAYALAAAVAAGHAEFAAVAKERWLALFDKAQGVTKESRGRGDAMEEIVGRIKLNGHLIEALYRGGEKVFPPAEGFEAKADALAEELFLDSQTLAPLPVYQGPPDIFVVVPHAIHGLALGVKRMGG